jgi:hypothetical protein
MFPMIPLFTPMVTSKSTQLSPAYGLPVAIAGLAIPLWFVLPWLSGICALFGIFLLLQASTLRLVFTDNALDIYRGEKLIRQFPYKDWKYWQIYFHPLPILFYFREVKSIHFLPILFDAQQLTVCLKQHCPIDRLK